MTELPEDYKARWEQFVNETLTETNKKNTADLVSFHTKTITGSILHQKLQITFNKHLALNTGVLRLSDPANDGQLC